MERRFWGKTGLKSQEKYTAESARLREASRGRLEKVEDVMRHLSSAAEDLRDEGESVHQNMLIMQEDPRNPISIWTRCST